MTSTNSPYCGARAPSGRKEATIAPTGRDLRGNQRLAPPPRTIFTASTGYVVVGTTRRLRRPTQRPGVV